MSKTTKTKKINNGKFTTPHEQQRHGQPAKAKAVEAKAVKAKAAPKAKKPRKGKLGGLLGHSVISVVRAMGRHGWDFAQAKAALDKAGVSAATFTIKRALKRGQKGERKIAPLSAKELAPLRAPAVRKTAKPVEVAAAA